MNTPLTLLTAEVVHMAMEPDCRITKGDALGSNSNGLVRPLLPGDIFRGFAEESKQTDGIPRHTQMAAAVRHSGRYKLNVEGAKPGCEGLPVFAIGKDRFTLKANGATKIGRVFVCDSYGEKAEVKFDA